MSNQPSTEQTLQKTLSILVHQAKLTPEELAILRLADLHLAGKTPNITFTPGGENAKSKKVDLNLDSHRALVGWLVARPDSITDYLFIDDDREGMSPEGIRAAVANDDAIEHTASPDKTDPVGDDDAADADATLYSMPPTTPVPPVRPPGSPPPPPPSAPEMGAAPSGFVGRPPFSKPPPTAPESGSPVGKTVPVPPPFAPEAEDRTPPAPEDEATPESGEAPAGGRESKPIPPHPEGMRGPRVPPKPIRKQGEEPSPALVKQEMETPAASPETNQQMPPPVSLKAEADIAEQAAPAEKLAGKAAVVGGIVAEEVKSDTAQEPATAEQAAPAEEFAGKAAVVGAIIAEESKPDTAKETVKPEETKKEEAKTTVPPAKKTTKPAAKKSGRSMMPLALGGGVVVLVLLCIACFGATGWLAMQEKSNGDLLASLGLSSGAVQETPEGVEIIVVPTSTLTPTLDSAFVSPVNSPLATPTLPATHTATPLPATNTPLPTNTPEPTREEPTATNTPVPTDTPVPPTNTPEPPDTEEETPTPEPEATEEAGFKYGVPILRAPKNETLYTGINEIKLEWEPVGELAADEQYAVRIVYKYNGEITYGGAQVKEPNWVVPIALYGKIDPPEHRYEWFVAVERLNEDGSGTAVSPESERMSFIWR